MAETISILGTPESLGEDWPKEVKCPYECAGGDVCVDTETGVCSECKRVFDIQPTEIIVGPDEEELTLSQHAELWCVEQGHVIPIRGTSEWDDMYAEWIEFAFSEEK